MSTSSLTIFPGIRYAILSSLYQDQDDKLTEKEKLDIQRRRVTLLTIEIKGKCLKIINCNQYNPNLKPIDYTPTYQIPLRFCLFVDIYYPGI
jgi:hypothetical protein